MFDIGFWELALIFIVALLVLGPARLPEIATRVGGWVGNARKIVRNLRAQMEEEIAVNERKPPAAENNKPADEPRRKTDETG